ncbi:hypothetical protein D3C74_291380 [compost metagenome]
MVRECIGLDTDVDLNIWMLRHILLSQGHVMGIPQRPESQLNGITLTAFGHARNLILLVIRRIDYAISA